MNFLKRSKRVVPLSPLQIFHRLRSQSSAEYCLNLVKSQDYENFLCSILLRNNVRAIAFAVRGFNIEVSKVADKVSQESIGLMRLKFWEETLNKCFLMDLKQVPKHPVAIELYKALTKAKLSKRYFNNLISSRREFMRLNGFKDMQHMESYSEQSVSNAYYLILEGAGLKNLHADHAASHLGKAQGIAQQIRSIPHSKRLNFLPIPQDLLLRNKISQEQIIRGRNSEHLRECVYEIASRAHQHLTKARNLLETVPLEARPSLLPAVPVGIYLNRLQKVNYNVFDIGLQQRPWKIFPLLFIANVRKKY
ncbi:NADH dehydrogenase (ubiquinone) complex I, assembly factor 6 isoform X2 [Cylas formicarius]|uniref:NADH dehydrogenase (ubiquinone) complex I, assembly factor 6 isoform X2 n=1 Tax=Cylas formicarius TaxID=197179 RepID=UPI00295893DA|nr:NADH dehydrogenase (ubiquinone) complex I, assembly factor 6 isoform X2 [Cylas formicarius]